MKKRILIIDDEDQIRRIYKKAFKAIGSSIFEVMAASSQAEATNWVCRFPIDIIILDIKMPDIDGKYMFEVIREYNPDLKVVIASVYSVDYQKKLIPGASDYFDKSQGMIKLLEMVSRILAAN